MNPKNPLPRWRGFNLVEMVDEKFPDREFSEDDFRWISDWGFDFVRLPLCYTLWTDPNDLYSVKEAVLEKIDRGIRLGERYGLHVCLNIHRAPGYCVAGRPEPFNLWKDPQAEKAFCFQWDLFAKRYKGIGAKSLSFNLVNEPEGFTPNEMTREDHDRVVRAAVRAIRQVDAERLIIADGSSWGNQPHPELADLGLAQSCRGYKPAAISHYKANWGGWTEFAWKDPAWPARDHRDDSLWDRQRLVEHYRPWAEMIRSGIGVHCGETGCIPFAPHEVFLRWFDDVLDVLTSLDIGYALWNFRGGWGVMDSNRPDVDYADWHGHKLDKQLLTMLQNH